MARRAVDPAHNPFLADELRRQARQPAVPRSLLLHALAVGSLFLGFLLLVRWPWGDESLPWQRFLAPHLVTGIAAVHVWLIIHASDSRVREAAQREETSRMWEMLLATPLTAVEIVLFKSVYPALYAGLIALVALPIYLLAAAMSGVSFGLLLMLYGVYGLLLVRLVAPLRPPAGRVPAERVAGKRGPRPRHAAGSAGSLFAWLWLLTWLGQALRPLSPLTSGMIITWPVVAAMLLPTPFAFYHTRLPPLAALLILGPAMFVLNLRWAARRLVGHATETPGAEPPGMLRRAVVMGLAAVVLGYAWPRWVEAGGLGAWMKLGTAPGDSVAALGWLLLAFWWLLFGVGGLLSLPAERLEAQGYRSPRFFSGWLVHASPGDGLRVVTGLVAAPLLLLVLGCMLAGRPPAPSALPWLGRTVVVATGAAALTAVLGRRVQAATAADTAGGILGAWLVAGLLLIAPLMLLFVPDPVSLRLAAVSPAMGFLTLLPPQSPLSPAALAPLPPWWLSPALNAGAAAFLSRSRRPRADTDRAATRATRRPVDGWMSHWVEQFAARADAPVLVRELRAGVRRSDWRQLLSKVSWIALLALLAVLYNPDIVTGLASALPLRLFPSDLTGAPLFSASLVAVLLMGLSWPVVFSSPVLGAGTFSQERRKGTLGFLLLTPLEEAEIVRGKLLGAVAPLLLTLALTFPVAGLAALFSGSLPVLWSFFFGYLWLLTACLTGASLGTLASLLRPADHDPQGLPLLTMLVLQGAKLYTVARLQYLLTGVSWVNSGKLEITAWFVIPLVALEAGLGLLAYIASVALLARARCRDLRFVTER